MEKLLVQAYERFGDNICVAGALAQLKNVDLIVATSHEFGDAFTNVPNIKKIIYTNNKDELNSYAREGYKILNCTMGEIPTYTSRLDFRMVYHFEKNGHKYLQPSAGFWPTKEESDWANAFSAKLTGKKILGVETGFTSNQSFVCQLHADHIVQKFKDKYHIVWLCNKNYPDKSNHIIRLDDAGRRNICALMPKLDLFISTFSGYFWASRGQGKQNIPKTYCLVLQRQQLWMPMHNNTIVLPEQFHNWIDNCND